MKLTQFLELYGSKMKFLETIFLKNVFFTDYGEEGLDLIEPEVDIERNDWTWRVWRIDFIVTTNNRKYAIECDGFNYHAAWMVSKERFNDLEAKRNETIRQWYILISLSKDQIIDTPEDAIYELRRTFNADKELYSLFLHWNETTIRPHDVQKKALKALDLTRKNEKYKWLVVLATWLWKTFLSIFDTLAMNSKTILFIVHNNHILKQTKNSFEKVMPNRLKEMWFFTWTEKNHENKNIIFSTIQTINREQNLHQFNPNFFDYIIIDETHHIAAPSYKIVSDYFSPNFFLWLTATPDRLDKKNILEFFDNNLVFEMWQSEAIKQWYLAKLRYKGFTDNVDYSNIYYNGFRYDVNDLNKSLMIENRDFAIIQKFKELAINKKTIGFCVSIEHADWSAEQFRKAWIDAVSIHSKIDNNNTNQAYQSASEIIDAFDNSKHQVAFVVDMFNEWIDIPDVECLLMLRPTASSSILTQQIWRGLRIAEGKDEILVLDFIWNYQTAHTILVWLWINKISDLEHDKEKWVYYYDNNGTNIEFQDEVIDIFRTMLSRASIKVRTELISEDWLSYWEYIANNTATWVNLFWSVGKKNNNLSIHLWALEYITKNNFSSNEELSETLNSESKKIFPNATLEWIRALFFSKLIWLIINTSPFELSEAYESIIKNKDNTDKFNELINNQVEKMYFYNDIQSLTDRHSENWNKRQIDKLFHIYPIFFIYQVIIYLKSEWYEQWKLTKFEIDHFILLSRNHEDVIDCAKKIILYREYKEKDELEKYLKQSSSMDSRFYKTLQYIDAFQFTPKAIYIKEEHLDIIEEKVIKFNQLLETKKLIQFNKDTPWIYKSMLYSKKSLLNYHK